MSIFDCILLFVFAVFIPTGIGMWLLFYAMFPTFSEESDTSFDKENNESEEKTTNWKFDPTNLKAPQLRLLLHIDPYIYRCASDEEKKKMDEILKSEQPKEKKNKESSELYGLAAWCKVWCDYCQYPDVTYQLYTGFVLHSLLVILTKMS